MKKIVCKSVGRITGVKQLRSTSGTAKTKGGYAVIERMFCLPQCLKKTNQSQALITIIAFPTIYLGGIDDRHPNNFTGVETRFT